MKTRRNIDTIWVISPVLRHLAIHVRVYYKKTYEKYGNNENQIRNPEN